MVSDAGVKEGQAGLGHDPNLRIMCVGYGEGLANEFSRQFRMVADSGWHRGVFPGMR